MRVVLLASLLSHKGRNTRRFWQHRAVFLIRNVVKAKNLDSSVAPLPALKIACSPFESLRTNGVATARGEALEP